MHNVLFLLAEYEDVLGTNIYYEEIEVDSEKQEQDAFKFQTPISLEYLAKSNKVLKLKLCKLPDILQIPDSDNVDLKFQDDYRIVIEKMKEGRLSIDDLVEKTNSNGLSGGHIQEPSLDVQNLINLDLRNKGTTRNLKPIPEIQPAQVIEAENPYNRKVINELIKQPMKTKKSFEVTDDIDTSRTGEINYSVLKQLYLQKLPYKNLPLNIDESKLYLHIDIENSMKLGIVNKTNFQKLTDDEKNELISLKNFENLSVPLQLSLLINQLKEEKKTLLNMSGEELASVDEFGRKPKDKYKILKYFAKDLWYYLFKNNKQ